MGGWFDEWTWIHPGSRNCPFHGYRTFRVHYQKQHATWRTYLDAFRPLPLFDHPVPALPLLFYAMFDVRRTLNQRMPSTETTTSLNVHATSQRIRFQNALELLGQLYQDRTCPKQSRLYRKKYLPPWSELDDTFAQILSRSFHDDVFSVAEYLTLGCVIQGKEDLCQSLVTDARILIEKTASLLFLATQDAYHKKPVHFQVTIEMLQSFDLLYTLFEQRCLTTLCSVWDDMMIDDQLTPVSSPRLETSRTLSHRRKTSRSHMSYTFEQELTVLASETLEWILQKGWFTTDDVTCMTPELLVALPKLCLLYAVHHSLLTRDSTLRTTAVMPFLEKSLEDALDALQERAKEWKLDFVIQLAQRICQEESSGSELQAAFLLVSAAAYEWTGGERALVWRRIVATAFGMRFNQSQTPTTTPTTRKYFINWFSV